MKQEMLFTLIPLAMLAVILQFTPLFTRRGIFFSATVDPDFPQSDDGRRLLRSYRLQAALWTLLAGALAALLVPQHPAYGVLLPVFLLVLGVAFSYCIKFRQVHAQYGVRRPEVRETSLSTAQPDGKIVTWLTVIPFLTIAAVALYLHAHWNQLPAQFPVHWGPDGQPNRWSNRDFMGVYGPLLMAAFMNLFLLVFAWALLLFSRKTTMRYVTVRVLQAVMYPVTFTFCMVVLMPLLTLPMWLIPSVMLVFVAGVIYWGYRKITAPAALGEIPEPQSDSYWKAGFFYYNPNDPAIFVSKRVGIGYTMNFANKISWLVLVGILLIALWPAIFASHK